MNLRFTLLADGPSDAALMPLLRWLIRQDTRITELSDDFAPPDKLPPASRGLMARAKIALALYPADILFVHRDAEKEPHSRRRTEILNTFPTGAVSALIVPVVPVRMTEAWFLFNEPALRRASGNPNGTLSLALPRIQAVESIPNPKAVLHDALVAACGLRGRNLEKFNVRQSCARLAERIDDFTPLLKLSAFSALARDVNDALNAFSRGQRKRKNPRH